jgi:CRISPR-associated endoribonuclease Cas6
MFSISKLQIEIELLDDFAPRGFWGSRLRGGFGDGLQLCLCPNSTPANIGHHSASCRCDFQRIFKPTQEILGLTLTGSPLGGCSNLPPPFVIEPPALAGYPPQGSRLNFNFLGIGPACDYLEQCVQAFQEFGRRGVERDEKRRRAKFLLIDVRDLLSYGRSVLIDGRLGSIRRQDIRDTVREAQAGPAETELTVCLRTNVQVIDKGMKSGNPLDRVKPFDSFWSFVSQVAHRTACLWQAYGNDWHGKRRYAEERGLLGKASREIVTLGQHLVKRELWGHSNLREVDKGLHGFTGTMTFGGDFSPFMELLSIGEIVHVGSETSSGLGQYSLALAHAEATYNEGLSSPSALLP